MVDYDPVVNKYAPALFRVERATSISSKLGEFRLGYSKLGGGEESAWIEVPSATFNYTAEYNLDEFNTPIIGSETASVSLSYRNSPAQPPLYPLDKIRIVYDGRVEHLLTVESTTITKSPSDEDNVRYDFVATLVGTYAAAMGKEICYGDLPKESPLDRISRWVTVIGYP